MTTRTEQKIGPTPGPWVFGPEHAGNEEYSVVGRKDGQGVSVALVVADEDVPPAHGEMLSNARLIAAAPDLVAALKSAARLLASMMDNMPYVSGNRGSGPATDEARAWRAKMDAEKHAARAALAKAGV